jgi:hypothetical protein
VPTERSRQAPDERNLIARQRRTQNAQWFTLKLIVGYVALLVLLSVAGICVYILIADRYSDRVVDTATKVLLTDIGGLLFVVLTRIMKPSSLDQL